jgi:phenylacetate-CoA ligase
MPNTLNITRPFDPSRVEEDLERMRAFEPQAGYILASAAHLLARYLLETGRTFPLRSVITSAEMLYPEQRAAIEAAFECPVFDNYGCNDGGAWGAECAKHTGFHQDVERAFIEVVDGRMVATDLWNTAFPFIRYENGDAGGWRTGSCDCGRSSPRFSISGRTADLIITPTQVVFPSFMNRALLHEALLDARVIQHSATEVEVLLVPSQLYGDAARAELDANLDGLLEGMDVTVRIVEAIPPTASGKHRVSVNRSGITAEDVLAHTLAQTQRRG